MSSGELIPYTSEDGAATIQLRAEGGMIRPSLAQIADLLGTDKPVLSRHIEAVFEEGQMVSDSVVARYATTAADGSLGGTDE